MGNTHFKILKEISEIKKKYFENYRDYCKKIKNEAKKILKDVKVIVFGSVVRGNFNPKSDIDVLVISDNLPENWEERRYIKIKLNSIFDDFLNPFQIHLANYKEYEEWYKKFIKDDFEEIL